MLQPLVSLLRVIPGCPVHLGKRQWAAPNRRPRALHRARRLPADLKPLCYNSEPRASIVCEFPRPRKMLPQSAVRTQTKTTWPQTVVLGAPGKPCCLKGRTITTLNFFFFFPSHLRCNINAKGQKISALLLQIEFSLRPRRNSQVLPSNTLLCRRRILFFFSK